MKDEDRIEKIYNEFWKAILEHDGVLDMKQLKKELADCFFVVRNAGKVYAHVTGGKITTLDHKAETVIEIAELYQQAWNNTIKCNDCGSKNWKYDVEKEDEDNKQ